MGISPGWLAAQALTWAAAAASLCAWLAERGGYPPAFGVACAGPAALWAWWLCRTRVATLHWDGAQWLLNDKLVHVSVALDLDRWMLLCLQSAEGGRRQWLPATARQAGAHWHGLRAALYSRAPESPLAAAAPTRVSAPD
jgi:hypothetical protein